MGSQCLFKREKNVNQNSRKTMNHFYKNEKKTFLFGWLNSGLRRFVDNSTTPLMNKWRVVNSVKICIHFTHFACWVSSENPVFLLFTHLEHLFPPSSILSNTIFLMWFLLLPFLFSLLSRLRLLLVALTWQNILDQYWYLTQQDCLFGQGSEFPRLEF